MTDNTTPAPLDADQALANLKAYSVFGNAHSVTVGTADGAPYYTGWIGGSLYSSRDGRKWAAVEALWRTG